MRGTAGFFGAAAAGAAALAAPAAGQWVLVPAPEWRFSAPAPVLLQPAPLPPATTTVAKPAEAKPRRVLVEKHYLRGNAATATVPAYVRKPEDAEFDQIVREFHFTDEPVADRLEEVPRDRKAVEPPAKMDMPKVPANSTGEKSKAGQNELFDDMKTKIPGPAAADAHPNGTGYLAPAPLPESPKAGAEALAISAVPVTGVAKASPNGTPLAEMEIRFVHRAAAGKAHAEQHCKTDRKGEFATTLEPGLWIVSLALPDGEFQKLGWAKVSAKDENRFRFE